MADTLKNLILTKLNKKRINPYDIRQRVSNTPLEREKKMKSEFKTELEISVCPENEGIYILDAPLVYESELLGKTVTVPKDFYTDLASVPRVPIAYMFYGGRSHREAVIHDYLYRVDSDPVVTCMIANRVFLEAMIARGKSKLKVAYPMFLGVCAGGWLLFHKKKVADRIS